MEKAEDVILSESSLCTLEKDLELLPSTLVKFLSPSETMEVSSSGSFGFRTDYMRALYRYGYDKARSGGFWENAPGSVAGVVGIEGGVVSGVINLESSGVGASDWRPRHEELYQEV